MTSKLKFCYLSQIITLIALSLSSVSGQEATYRFGDVIHPPDDGESYNYKPVMEFEVSDIKIYSGGKNYVAGEKIEYEGEENATFEILKVDPSGSVEKIIIKDRGVFNDGLPNQMQRAKLESESNKSNKTLELKLEFTSKDYYYSPHSKKVYATCSGNNKKITWKKSNAGTKEVKFKVDPFKASKPPRNLFWTINRNNNLAVSITKNQVPFVNIVYNNLISKYNTDIIKESVDVTAESRTVWYDEKASALYAESGKGFIFIEYLGDFEADSEEVREHLGFEIVKVQKTAKPKVVQVDLGELLHPDLVLNIDHEDGYEIGNDTSITVSKTLTALWPGNVIKFENGGIFTITQAVSAGEVKLTGNLISADLSFGETGVLDWQSGSVLQPHPVINLTQGSKRFYYDYVDKDGRKLLYATRETQNVGDLVLYWMEKGNSQVMWPVIKARYSIKWPADASKYHHYARASVNSPDIASESSIQLPTINTPSIEYQSHEDLSVATLTPQNKFYTWLRRDELDSKNIKLSNVIEHRTLIRMQNENDVWFLRVYSYLREWLDSEIAKKNEYNNNIIDKNYTIDDKGKYAKFAVNKGERYQFKQNNSERIIFGDSVNDNSKNSTIFIPKTNYIEIWASDPNNISDLSVKSVVEKLRPQDIISEDNYSKGNYRQRPIQVTININETLMKDRYIYFENGGVFKLSADAKKGDKFIYGELLNSGINKLESGFTGYFGTLWYQDNKVFNNKAISFEVVPGYINVLGTAINDGEAPIRKGYNILTTKTSHNLKVGDLIQLSGFGPENYYDISYKLKDADLIEDYPNKFYLPLQETNAGRELQIMYVQDEIIGNKRYKIIKTKDPHGLIGNSTLTIIGKNSSAEEFVFVPATTSRKAKTTSMGDSYDATRTMNVSINDIIDSNTFRIENDLNFPTFSGGLFYPSAAIKDTRFGVAVEPVVNREGYMIIPTSPHNTGFDNYPLYTVVDPNGHQIHDAIHPKDRIIGLTLGSKDNEDLYYINSHRGVRSIICVSEKPPMTGFLKYEYPKWNYPKDLQGQIDFKNTYGGITDRNIIENNNTVYFISNIYDTTTRVQRRFLHALNSKDGKLRWIPKQLPDEVIPPGPYEEPRPMIMNDSIAFNHTNNQIIVCTYQSVVSYDTDGNRMWISPIKIRANRGGIKTSSKGNIFISGRYPFSHQKFSNGGYVVSLNSKGEYRWDFKIGYGIDYDKNIIDYYQNKTWVSKIAEGQGNAIIVGGLGGNIWAINDSDGKELWKHNTQSSSHSVANPVVDDGGNIFFHANREIHMKDKNGDYVYYYRDKAILEKDRFAYVFKGKNGRIYKYSYSKRHVDGIVNFLNTNATIRVDKEYPDLIVNGDKSIISTFSNNLVNVKTLFSPKVSISDRVNISGASEESFNSSNNGFEVIDVDVKNKSFTMRIDKNASVVRENNSNAETRFELKRNSQENRPLRITDDAIISKRISPPDVNLIFKNGDEYWSGMINTDFSDSYNPNAYIDPVEHGFEKANQGAIIPVNISSENNQLEVWWYKKLAKSGFDDFYIPSLIVRYNLLWPHEVDEYRPRSKQNAIVLSSNDGTGKLSSIESAGNIYYQNDPEKAGYNPNEEHALMIGDQVYALRDDLNIKTSRNYSSEPYVLIEYTSKDGRPKMKAFQVIRELGDDKFSYFVEAGNILQPPMPLPLLAKPLVVREAGFPARTLNNVISDGFIEENIYSYTNDKQELYEITDVEIKWKGQNYDFNTIVQLTGDLNDPLSNPGVPVYEHQKYVVRKIDLGDDTIFTTWRKGPVTELGLDSYKFKSSSIDPKVSYGLNPSDNFNYNWSRFKTKEGTQLPDYSFHILEKKLYHQPPIGTVKTVVSRIPNLLPEFKDQIGEKLTVETNVKKLSTSTDSTKWAYSINQAATFRLSNPHRFKQGSVLSLQKYITNEFGEGVYSANKNDLRNFLVTKLWGEKEYPTKEGEYRKLVTGFVSIDKMLDISNVSLLARSNGGDSPTRFRLQIEDLHKEQLNKLIPGSFLSQNVSRVLIISEKRNDYVWASVNNIILNGENALVDIALLYSEEWANGQWADTFPFSTSENLTFFMPSMGDGLNRESYKSDDKHKWALSVERHLPLTRDEEYKHPTLEDRKGNIWVYRAGHNGDRAAVYAQFYYKTLEGFHFPGLSKQPRVGTVTPYLTPNIENESYSKSLEELNTGEINEWVYGDFDNNSISDKNALPIKFISSWPEQAPVMRIGQTLTTATAGLPGVRGQSSVEIVYQQSSFVDTQKNSVVLHDPTREKKYNFKGDDKIPDSISTEIYRGKTYFPELPPHLVDRLFYDPNRGEKGALVFKGEFIDSVVGQNYLLLNVTGKQDIDTILSLCTDHSDKANWENIVGSLSTRVEKYLPTASNPDDTDFIVSDNEIKINDLASVSDDDVAVDSYALTAVGPGHGYISLLSGNGFVFTPSDEPVSLNIIKVIPTLARGEVRVVPTSNPLSEKITMQQVLDFAGNMENFDFEWKISPPINGKPPSVYKYDYISLLSKNEDWHHMHFPGNSQINKYNEIEINKRFELESLNGIIPIKEIKFIKINERDGENENQLTVVPVDKRVLEMMGGNSNFEQSNPIYLTARTKDLTYAEGIVTNVDNEAFSVKFSDSVKPDEIDIIYETSRRFAGESYLVRDINRPLFDSSSEKIKYINYYLSINLEENLSVDIFLDGKQIISANKGLDVNNNISKATYAKISGTGGNGFEVGDTVVLKGGVTQSEDSFAKFVVKTIENGQVREMYELGSQSKGNAGAYTTVPANPVVAVPVSGSGSGLKLDIVFEQDNEKPLNTPTVSPPTQIKESGWKTYSLPASLFLNDQDSFQLAVKINSVSKPGIVQGINIKMDGAYVQDRVNVKGTKWHSLDSAYYKDGNRAVLGGTAGVEALGDNYLIMRYTPLNESHSCYGKWSLWTDPALAEGWIKRVLDGINPFEQRTKNYFDKGIEASGSMLTQAGTRWEGDVALNMNNIDDHGLIEIYETVLNRGKMLSIDAGINYAPANDALLLAAGYLNDLYMFLGNEARADAANPTIGISTTDGELGSVATSLFAFKGQVSSLIEEELGLLRGRDDFMQPGVRRAPAYNRLYWNFTRGIDSGEVIYSLNYNINEDANEDYNGTIDAVDAQRMYPQGHGDAYGHYLSALKGYYKLILNKDFSWVPQSETVTILGVPVAVDYMDERKFAAAAVALARSGNQITDLTWRKDYSVEKHISWENFSNVRKNEETNIERHWGTDHWANRTAVGSYLNWVSGNAMLPDEDPDESHEGIEIVDRSTVPELIELVSLGEEIQTKMDSAESGANPLGLSSRSLSMDISPDISDETHFDQVYRRALQAVNNAANAFDDAKNITRMMRVEQDSNSEYKKAISSEERAFEHKLIDIYGTPYPGDIGPGKLYPQGYEGPDIYHHMYIYNPDVLGSGYPEEETMEFKLDIQESPYSGNPSLYVSNESFADMRGYNTVNNIDEIISGPIGDDSAGIAGRDYFKDKRQLNKHYITYNLNSHGFFERPITFTGKRKQPGILQSALKDVMAAEADLVASLGSNSSLKEDLDKAVISLEKKIIRHKIERTEKEVKHYLDFTRESINRVTEFMEWMGETKKEWAGTALEAMLEGFPRVNGTSNDLTSSIRAGFISMAMVEKSVDKGIEGAWKAMQNTYDQILSERSRWMDFYGSEVDEWKSDLEEEISNLDGLFGVLGDSISDINAKLAVLDEAKGKYRILLAQGDRLLTEREWFRERAAAIVQGYRTKDASFRIFRNEKLERYKTLFDLSSRYTYLAVKAFDYETGLLNTDAGRRFTSRVINSRAIGVMKDGEPQFGGGNAGDPGLSSILAEMKADYEVLRGRLGFNNPDTQGTTISLRLEKYRILPGAAGEDNWRELLYRNRRSNLLDDPDIRNNAIQIDQGDGLPVPGLVFEFSTSIANGYNVFGLPLAGGDSQFSPSNFATKIHGVGIGFENYKGMESISTNNGVVSGAGGDSPSTPTAPWLEPLNLSKTPYVYLIPLGQDKMRSPPLGDASVIRSWSVNDTTIPMPFNIGASDFSSRSIWQAQDTLSGEFLNTRKHQSFRAVLWNVDGGVGTFDNLSPQSAPSNILNNRLIGRSVWNTKWKLVIPGRTLLHNADEGIERFINSVSDIKLHFESYSYSGN